MLSAIQLVLLVLAGLGFVLSAIAHVCGWLGVHQPLGSATWLLHVGIFAVFAPGIFMTKSLHRAGYAKLPPTPRWLRVLMGWVCGYAAISFVWFMATAQTGPLPERDPHGDTPDAVFRGFSGLWLAFYVASFSMLYQVRQAMRIPLRWCPNGHVVAPAEEACAICGVAVEPAAISGSGRVSPPAEIGAAD